MLQAYQGSERLVRLLHGEVGPADPHCIVHRPASRRDKEDTRHTWEWHVKDTERCRLPLSEELLVLLAEHQILQPEGLPYVFAPPTRYARIQIRRQRREWSVEDGRCPVNNFTRHFKAILPRAGIQEGTFHDLRRTALSNWLSNGLGEFDVMNLAGHSCFETTRAFYLAVHNDLLQRARAITRQMLSANSVANAFRDRKQDIAV